MRNFLKENSVSILSLLVLFYISFFFFICYLKYKYFIYNDFDLAVHSQSLWSIIHGSTFSSILGKSFLGNHAHFILFLIAPVFFLFSSPLTLLFLQTLSLGICAIIIFKIARIYLDETWSLLISILYLIYPAVSFSNLFEFHPTVFAVPFLLLMFYSFLKQNSVLLLIFTALALLCQENISLIIGAFYIYALFATRNKGKSAYALLIILSFLWFAFSVYVVMPFFAREKIRYFEMFYGHLGGSVKSILSFIITHPIKLLKICLAPGNIKYFLDLFVPLSLLPLFGIELLFPIAPIFLQHLLSVRSAEHTIYFHYTLEMIPFIFLATILGIKRLIKFDPIKNRQHFIKVIILVLGIFFYLSIGPTNTLFAVKNYKNNNFALKQQIIDLIPEGAGVVSTFEFLPKLSLSNKLYSFHNVLLSTYAYSKMKFILPVDIEFAIIDFTDKLTFYDFFTRGSENKLQDFFKNNKWGVRAIDDTLVFYQKGLKSNKYLYRILDFQEIPEMKLKVTVDTSITLNGFNIRKEESGKIDFEFYWQTSKKTNKDIAVFFDFVDQEGKIQKRIFRPICYRIMPTYSWKATEQIREYQSLTLPKNLKKGSYSIKMGFYYYGTLLVAPLESNLKDIDGLGRIELTKFTI